VKEHASGEAAKMLGVSESSVCNLRKRLGIPWLRGIRWTRGMVAMLGTKSDAALARQWGFWDKTVGDERRRRGIPAWSTHHRWTKAELELLGTMPDADLARQLGMSIVAVRGMRQKRGVQPLVPRIRLANGRYAIAAGKKFLQNS
jgi:hypothetical protein